MHFSMFTNSVHVQIKEWHPEVMLEKDFVVKIFLDSMASAKIKHTKKLVCIINYNVVWGHLPKNYFTQKFIVRSYMCTICDTTHLRFTALLWQW